MSWVFTVLAYSLPFLGVVLVITLVHEFGHFIVARRCGVRVEAFSVGFGRELLGFTDRHGTRFKLSLLPLGGYVKMFGEQGFVRDAGGRIRLLDRHERDCSYFHKSVAERAAIVFAGPLVNIVFGGALLALLIFAKGRVVHFRCRIDQFEVISKLSMHALSTIPHNVQPAALLRARQPKGGDNDVAARLHALPHRP